MVVAFDWQEFVKGLVLLVSLVAGNTSIVEILKNLVAMLVAQFPALAKLEIKDRVAFVVAAIVAFVLGSFGGVDLVNIFGLSSYLTPELSQFLSSLVILLSSNILYNKAIKKPEYLY